MPIFTLGAPLLCSSFRGSSQPPHRQKDCMATSEPPGKPPGMRENANQPGFSFTMVVLLPHGSSRENLPGPEGPSEANRHDYHGLSTVLVLQAIDHCVWLFYVGARDPNLGPHTRTAVSVPTDPSTLRLLV